MNIDTMWEEFLHSDLISSRPFFRSNLSATLETPSCESQMKWTNHYYVTLLTTTFSLSPLHCSRTVWEPSYTGSRAYFPCGWHHLLPLHRVFLYGGILPYWLTHTPVSGKWHVVGNESQLHKWVLYVQNTMEKKSLLKCSINIKDGNTPVSCNAVHCWPMTYVLVRHMSVYSDAIWTN